MFKFESITTNHLLFIVKILKKKKSSKHSNFQIQILNSLSNLRQLSSSEKVRKMFAKMGTRETEMITCSSRDNMDARVVQSVPSNPEKWWPTL